MRKTPCLHLTYLPKSNKVGKSEESGINASVMRQISRFPDRNSGQTKRGAMFQGAAALSLDTKGRLAIPARHRDALAVAAEGHLV